MSSSVIWVLNFFVHYRLYRISIFVCDDDFILRSTTCNYLTCEISETQLDRQLDADCDIMGMTRMGY
jgi:hypothetical protein